MEFPRLVYKSPSVHLLVEDEKQHETALADGWFTSVLEAAAGGEAITAKQRADVGSTSDGGSRPTRDELEQKASELGIAFSAKVSDKKLAEAIASKLAGSGGK